MNKKEKERIRNMLEEKYGTSRIINFSSPPNNDDIRKLLNQIDRLERNSKWVDKIVVG